MIKIAEIKMEKNVIKVDWVEDVMRSSVAAAHERSSGHYVSTGLQD